MRQIIVNVPRGLGERILQIAREHDGRNLVAMEGRNGHQSRDVVIIHVPNAQIEEVIQSIQDEGDAHMTLIPRGIIPLVPPAAKPPEETIEVSSLSPLEVFLGGLQSIGSWKGFIGYSICGGIIAWTGLYTEKVYLLTGAMLISPFAGPAMCLALGTARGDSILIRRSILRYFSSLLVCVGVAWIMSLVFDQRIATNLMTQISLVSALAVVLPLTAGAAGALNLCQSERNSLVTAAGPGMLVAASLSPPAAAIGMGLASGKWDAVVSAVFVLLLQLVGINVSGALVFALFGLKPEGPRFHRGRVWLRRVSYGLSLVALAALLFWQFQKDPFLEKSSLAKDLTYEVKAAVNGSGQARLVQADVNFTRADIQGKNSLLVVVHAQRTGASKLSDGELEDRLRRAIITDIRKRNRDVTPLVDLTIFPAETQEDFSYP